MSWKRIYFDTEEELMEWYDVYQGQCELKDLTKGAVFGFDYKLKE